MAVVRGLSGMLNSMLGPGIEIPFVAEMEVVSRISNGHKKGA